MNMENSIAIRKEYKQKLQRFYKKMVKRSPGACIRGRDKDDFV